tara:strand:- start:1455 stop:1997 length:543 start_codon:yes stop_codon:yes gene_type:complete
MNEKLKGSWFPEVALEGSGWNALSDSSRLWLYVADRMLSSIECQRVAEELERFTAEWAAHGTELHASWKLQGSRVVAIALDESRHGASGCSIDASIRCMQGLSEVGSPSIDWLRRDCVLFCQAESDFWEEMNLSAFWMARKAGLIQDDTAVLNALCSNKGDWEVECFHDFSASWHRDMWQ